MLQSQGMADAVRQIGVSEVTYYRWRKEFGGIRTDQCQWRRKNRPFERLNIQPLLNEVDVRCAEGALTARVRARRWL